VRTLLIDNHDSYTFNLFQLIAEVNGIDPVVMTNDDRRLASISAGSFDSAVISPGPGRPQSERDIGYVPEFLQKAAMPVLGVCLGHQAIAYQAGAEVGPAPQPRHGHLTTVRHDGDQLFGGIPAQFTAVRYHSLCVREPLPEVLTAIAWSEDGVIMSIRHQELPYWGVQFHPESIASHFGKELLTNFAHLALQAKQQAKHSPLVQTPVNLPSARPDENTGGTDNCARDADTRSGCSGQGKVTLDSHLQPIVRMVRTAADTETIFTRLLASSPSFFWLDSSMVQPGLSRFSFLGDATGPMSETLTYRVGEGKVSISDASGTRSEPGNAFDVLERRLQERRLDSDDLKLPFDLVGGYVGYFGYEMKADCGADAAYTAPAPDALWIFADRLVAVDHESGITYLVAIHDGSNRLHAAAREWVDATAQQLADLVLDDSPTGETEPDAPRSAGLCLPDYLVRDEVGYQQDIEECQHQLRLGESYEICLTNRLHLPFDDTDLAFYLRLRRANPAPYSALLRAGGITVFSSSPERFLRIGHDLWVESRPIKGTAPRHPDPDRDACIAAELASNAKTRAENLMIVDLLRNDLGQVCEIGSVSVSKYMAVESYATVHQLVSTIQGQLRPTVSAVECVRHCFPGGSMTGAPKLRTMEIIDRLETEARGVYSGALGYFGLTGGSDLSIVIRTAVRQGDTLAVGAGGAIVLDSTPEDEYEEMILKAAAPLRAYQSAPQGSAVR
jgi:para-aminobenzoate synthetase